MIDTWVIPQINKIGAGSLSKIKLEEIIMPGWDGWDGNGISTIPAKNVTLQDGTNGCIIIDGQCIAVYDKPHNILNDGTSENDEGTCFVEMSETHEEADGAFNNILSQEDIEEAKAIYRKYLKSEAALENE